MRLIDAEALEVALHNFFDGKVINEPTYILRDVFCHIDGAPTVDITEEQAIDRLHKTGWLPMHDKEMTERQQGKRIFHKDYNESCRYGCNLCGNLNNIPHNFCPNCGADMRKGDIYGST